GLHRRDDRMGLFSLGNRMVLPSLLLVRRLLSDLLPVLENVRLRRLVQPIHRNLRHRGKNLWAVRRRRFRRTLQPEHRNLRAGSFRLWSIRRARRSAGLQSAPRNLSKGTLGFGRLWQLGFDASSARRQLGEHQTIYEQRRQHDASYSWQRRRNFSQSAWRRLYRFER